jgi:general secretion pathway protein J
MHARARGFTLIELLVALSITALILAMGYGGLASITRQREQNGASMQRLKKVQLALDIMARDFSQLSDRPVRDGLGPQVQQPLVAGPDNTPPIEFTRGGWANPLGAVRSTEQRIAYSLEDGKLMRSWWPELDGQAQVLPAKEPLLSDVSSIKIQYMDAASHTFQRVWPPTQTQAPVQGTLPAPVAQAANALPIAVSITVTLKDLGDVTRIVEVANCAPNCP